MTPARDTRAAVRGVAAFAVVLAALVAACEAEPAGEGLAALGISCSWADVVSVTDGDTIRVEIDSEVKRLRYIGIDTPEVGENAEPFGEEATAANAALVAGGRVCLEVDASDRDRFDRLLRYVWLEDGTLVNEALVRDGLAEAVRFPPDTKRHDAQLAPAEKAARAEGLGIWSIER